MKLLAIGLMVCNLSIVATMQEADSYNPIETGNKLLRALNEPANSIQRALATGYVQGVSNSMEVLYPNQSLSCTPEGLTVSQMLDVLKRYLENHPETQDQPAIVLIVAATRQAFPCTKARK